MKLIFGKKLAVIFILFAIFTSFLVYKSSITTYFFQDDWFSLRISNAKNLADFFGFFVPSQDVIYYRPIGMQLPFFIIRSLFGINPLPFHILIFATHIVNIILVYLLIKLIKKDIFTALLVAFMYGVSAVHYTTMFWPATYAFVLGPGFLFLSFIFYILAVQKKSQNIQLLSVGVFILGLLTNEITAVLLPILLFYQLYIKKLNLKRLLPYFISVISIFILRFLIFPPPVTGSYEIGLSKELVLNLRAYFLWSFNLPEEIKAQFVSLLGLNQQFIKDFSEYFWLFTVTFFVSIFAYVIIPFIFMILKKDWKLINLLLFGISWFLIGLLPVIFFTQHSFSYYLPISLVGLLLFLTVSFKNFIDFIYSSNKLLTLIIVTIVLINWTLSSIVTIDFNSKIHWAPRRAKLSKMLVSKALKLYPVGNIDSDYIFVRPSSEYKLSLNNQDAFRVIYNNADLITVYRYMIYRIVL